MSMFKNIVVALAVTALAACGGGGGGSSTPPVPVNVKPTAQAGSDQSVDEGATVTLSGSGTDSDGTIASYAWTQQSGASVSLSAADAASTTFVAPATNSSESIVLVLTVTDDDGATDTDTVTVTVNTTNQGPTAHAGAMQSVVEGATVTLDASASSDSDGSIASYSWAQVSGPSATLSAGTTAMPTFTAPAVSSTQSLVFEVTVTDDRDATAMAQVTIEVTADPLQNNAPTANAGTDQSVTGTSSVTLDGSGSNDADGSIASYLWSQTAGTAVTLATPTAMSASFTAPDVAVTETLSFKLMVTDNEGATAEDLVDIEVTPAPAGATISGKVTYDNVPHNSNNSLNYNGITQDPVRGALVELLENSTVVATTVTDANGDYSVVAENNKNVMVRVKAQMLQVDTQSWNVQIVDNTQGSALYTLDSSVIATGNQSAISRNLHAASGWGGSSYTSTRAAAPFHILDRVYDIVDKLKTVDANLNLSRLLINWSPNNVAQSGDKTTGQITTSHYTNSNIFLLGAVNSDTDEYDGHVIIHEWGHYFEDNNARSDSIGGSHGGGDRLDMRVAFGEGFGNAWSGIITDDPAYRDSFGNAQSQGFSINVDNNNNSNPGWFSEGSVQSILYDAYDANVDGSDTANLGLQPLYDTLVGKQRNSEAFTSIFSFMTYLKEDNASAATALNTLLSGQNIQTNIDIWGSTETDNEGQANVLPVYVELNPGDSKQACTVTSFGTSNKLGNHRYVKMNIPANGSYTLRLTPSASSDLDGNIYTNGNYITGTNAGGTGTVNITATLATGTSVATTVAYNAAGTDLMATCYDVELIQN